MDKQQPRPGRWSMSGTLRLAVWRSAPQHLPGQWRLPMGARLSLVGGAATVITLWADCPAGGFLRRQQLMVALAVCDGRGRALSVTEAWTSDEQTPVPVLSDIPAQRGAFILGGTALTSRTGRRGLGRGTHRACMIPQDGAGTHSGRQPPDGVTALHQDVLRLPLRRPLRTRLLQPALLDQPPAAAQDMPLHLTGTARLARARLISRPSGPLHYLTSSRPLAALTVYDACLTAGPRQ
ncbi:hypothetical protein ACIQ6R_26775 [Streptomyces sp. NPDC096048]|uniref:hypothetical protein n=1 Tax=Streptomyces sp. NPDC096048 TaxID=3366072 RepID=UPI0038158528